MKQINCATIVLICTVIALLQTLACCQEQAKSFEDPNNEDNNEIERPSPMPIEHLSSSACQANECLVVGMQAYSEPRCQELGGEGDFCRPESWADNKTLYYPNKILEAENIFTLFCPCSKGLECDRATCKQQNS